MKRITSLILAAGAAVAMSTTACTPEEFTAWSAWHDQDPKAAMDFVEDTYAQPAPAPARSSSGGNTVWDRLAQCESGGNWSISTGNGFYGGVQFSLTSWRAVGGTGYPHQHSRAEQINRAEMLKDIQGWGAWPACSRKLGLR